MARNVVLRIERHEVRFKQRLQTVDHRLKDGKLLFVSIVETLNLRERLVFCRAGYLRYSTRFDDKSLKLTTNSTGHAAFFEVLRCFHGSLSGLLKYAATVPMVLYSNSCRYPSPHACVARNASAPPRAALEAVSSFKSREAVRHYSIVLSRSVASPRSLS